MYGVFGSDISLELYDENDDEVPCCVSFTSACIYTKNYGDIGVDLVGKKYCSSGELSDDVKSILKEYGLSALDDDDC